VVAADSLSKRANSCEGEDGVPPRPRFTDDGQRKGADLRRHDVSLTRVIAGEIHCRPMAVHSHVNIV